MQLQTEGAGLGRGSRHDWKQEKYAGDYGYEKRIWGLPRRHASDSACIVPLYRE